MSANETGHEPGAELAGHGPGDERLAAAGRPVQQQAAAQALAVQLAQLRVAHRGQERGLEPLLDLVHPGHVGQLEGGALGVEGLGRGAGRVGGGLLDCPRTSAAARRSAPTRPGTSQSRANGPGGGARPGPAPAPVGQRVTAARWVAPGCQVAPGGRVVRCPACGQALRLRGRRRGGDSGPTGTVRAPRAAAAGPGPRCYRDRVAVPRPRAGWPRPADPPATAGWPGAHAAAHRLAWPRQPCADWRARWDRVPCSRPVLSRWFRLRVNRLSVKQYGAGRCAGTMPAHIAAYSRLILIKFTADPGLAGRDFRHFGPPLAGSFGCRKPQLSVMM